MHILNIFAEKSKSTTVALCNQSGWQMCMRFIHKCTANIYIRMHALFSNLQAPWSWLALGTWSSWCTMPAVRPTYAALTCLWIPWVPKRGMLWVLFDVQMKCHIHFLFTLSEYNKVAPVYHDCLNGYKQFETVLCSNYRRKTHVSVVGNVYASGIQRYKATRDAYTYNAWWIPIEFYYSVWSGFSRHL